MSSWRDLPTSEQVSIWESSVPGSADRILRQIEFDYEHRRRMDLIDVRFRVFGATLAAIGITGIFWLTKYLVDQGATGLGIGVFGTSVAALVGLALKSDRLRR
ncbi:hypothetical protein ACKI1I_42690 [Streptomyces turgidiscabies]|uniref:hypothetical protein n=1 Tax=Streptomyces turgidiscabies TaxID=85558 RepID=UPI0038F62FEC